MRRERGPAKAQPTTNHCPSVRVGANTPTHLTVRSTACRSSIPRTWLSRRGSIPLPATVGEASNSTHQTTPALANACAPSDGQSWSSWKVDTNQRTSPPAPCPSSTDSAEPHPGPRASLPASRLSVPQHSPDAGAVQRLLGFEPTRRPSPTRARVRQPSGPQGSAQHRTGNASPSGGCLRTGFPPSLPATRDPPRSPLTMPWGYRPSP